MNIKKAFAFIRKINFTKTIWANLHYVGLSGLRKLPIIVYKGVKFRCATGRIVFLGDKLTAGRLKIGAPTIGTTDVSYVRTVFEHAGTVTVAGEATIGAGCRICVGSKGELQLGDGMSISGETHIVCLNRIQIGDGALLSWGITIMDSDMHKVTDMQGNVLNPNAPIVIGSRVWVGCRSMILKGVSIADNTIIAAGSLITRNVTEQFCVAGGQDGKVLKRDVKWED